MKMYKEIIFGILLIIIALCAWAPWLTSSRIEGLLRNHSTRMCPYSKTIGVEKALFGARVIAEYVCTNMENGIEFVRQEEKFVSFISTVY